MAPAGLPHQNRHPFAEPGLLADAEYLEVALATARRSVAAGGGPFGAVVVHDGLVLGMGTNDVARTFDPTAHAEVVAIRAACRRLNTDDLSATTLYTGTEPCPLCLQIAHWARIPRVVFAIERALVTEAGCAEETIYEAFVVPSAARALLVHRPLPAEAGEPFREWREATVAAGTGTAED